LGRDDEAELVAVAIAALEERLAIGDVGVGRVELARIALAGHAVALYVAQVRAGDRQPLGAQTREPGLHHHAARSERGQSVAARQQPADGAAAADAAAVEAAAADGTFLGRAEGGGDHAREVAPRLLALAMVPGPAELGG